MKKIVTWLVLVLVLASCSTSTSTNSFVDKYNKAIDKNLEPINEENFEEIEEDGFGKMQTIHQEQLGERLELFLYRRLDSDEEPIGYGGDHSRGR